MRDRTLICYAMAAMLAAAALVRDDVAIAALPPSSPVPAIADVLTSSAWDAQRLTGGSPQKAAFRIDGGVIRHLDQPHPVGVATLDAEGNLIMAFVGHRKLSGNAIVSKVGNGRWEGFITLANGTTWPLVLQRR